jgi:hypothetical protein
MRHSLSTASSPQLAKKPFIADIVRKATERLGRKLVWRVATHLEALPSPAPADAARDALRDLAIFLSDEEYAAMVQAYAVPSSSSDGVGSGGNNNNKRIMDIAALLADLCTLPLSPRRQYVLDLVLRKLDPNGTGVISYSTLSDNYDVLRHPKVCNGARTEDDVLMAFFDNFEQEDGRCMEQLTTAEFRLYAVGISSAMKEDTEFELWCTRSFCLDRPKMKSGEETGRLMGSREHSRQSRFLGEGRHHPLYSTTYNEYGKEATQADYKLPANGRPQQFTRNAVVRTGGATSMNM